ncbi:MAG TPA: hypothetical protein VF492_05285 [Verrucomicrobiae bacterium]
MAGHFDASLMLLGDAPADGQPHLDVGLDGDEAVLDLVRAAGGEESQIGETVEPPEVFLQVISPSG